MSASSERSNSSDVGYSRTYTNLNALSKELKESNGKLSPHRAARGKKGPRLQRSHRRSVREEDCLFDQMAKACKGKEHRATVVDTRKRLTKPPPGSALSPPEQNCSQPSQNDNMLRIPSSRHNFVSGGVEIQQSTGESEY